MDRIKGAAYINIFKTWSKEVHKARVRQQDGLAGNKSNKYRINILQVFGYK